MHRRIIVGLVAGGLMAAGWRITARASAAPNETSAAPAGVLSPEDAARLNARLDQIAETDQQIAGRFDQIMQELQIVKIRATIKRPTDEE